MTEEVETYPEYELNSFMDFCDIPEDKLDHCLEDFKIFIKQAIGMKRMIEEMAGLAKESGLLSEEDMPPEGQDLVEFNKFIWIDDGKHEVTKTFHFTSNDNEEVPFLSIKQDDDGNLEFSGAILDEVAEDVGNLQDSP